MTRLSDHPADKIHTKKKKLVENNVLLCFAFKASSHLSHLAPPTASATDLKE